MLPVSFNHKISPISDLQHVSDLLTNRTAGRPALRVLTLFLLFAELLLGEVHVDGDVQGAEEVVILVVGHALALLTDPGPGPSDLFPLHAHLVTVQVLCGTASE